MTAQMIKITLNENLFEELESKGADEAKAVLDKAAKLKIQNHAEYEAVADAVFDVVEKQREKTAERDELLAPAKELVEKIRAKYSPRLAFYEKAVDALKGAMRAYVVACEEARAVDLQKSVALNATNPEKARDLVAHSELRIAPKVKGVSFTGRLKWEVVDEKKLPAAYWKKVPDEEAIQRAVDAREIGLKEGVAVKDSRTITITPARRVKE